MRRSTTSVGTERPLLGLLLLAELILAVTAGRHVRAPPAPPARRAGRTHDAHRRCRVEHAEPARRTHRRSSSGWAEHTAPLLTRIARADRRRRGGRDRVLGRRLARATSSSSPRDPTSSSAPWPAVGRTSPPRPPAERIVFAPGAAAMSDAALRIVLRHELFHFATRADTASDAPRWLTEGVADFVARPHTARPAPQRAAALAATAHRRRPRQPRRGPITGLRPGLVVQPVRRRPVRHRHAAGAVPARLRGGPSRRANRHARDARRGPRTRC